MKLRVSFNGVVDVPDGEAVILRGGNRRVVESSLGYKLDSGVAELPMFAGRESTIRASVRIEEDEAVAA